MINKEFVAVIKSHVTAGQAVDRKNHFQIKREG
jgi:hypothetical protein